MNIFVTWPMLIWCLHFNYVDPGHSMNGNMPTAVPNIYNTSPTLQAVIDADYYCKGC